MLGITTTEGTSSLRGPRSSTLEAEEGRIQHSAVSPTRITEEPLTAEPTEPQQEQISTLQLADETKSDTICRLKARYLWTLDKVQEFEKGPIYRCLLWFPIIQQTFKAVFVRGAPFTHVLGSIFIISFLLVEIPHFSARKPLSKEGRREAQELMTKWDQDSKLQTLAASRLILLLHLERDIILSSFRHPVSSLGMAQQPLCRRLVGPRVVGIPNHGTFGLCDARRLKS